jgi:NAD(P)-dependent dehydrogenase (short-subunit alcohol dehydrogenase family)
MIRRLDGRAVLVTGGAGAFGGATLKVLRHLGADAIGLDRKAADGVLECDIADDEQVTEATAAAVGQLGGRLDTVIHYAGIGPAVDIGAMPDAQVREAIDVNLLGTWRVTAAAMPALLRAADGQAKARVIITTSLLAVVTMPFTAAYTVTKRGLTAYADVLRAEYGTHLAVTTVYPGYVDTPIHDRSRAAGVSLDGLVPAERRRDTVLTVVRAAAAARPPRDTASTPLGQGMLRLSRHAPRLIDRIVATQTGRLVRNGQFATAQLSEGLIKRHDPNH